MFKLRRLAPIATLITAVMLFGATSAFAYWTITGTGTGTAAVATPDPLVISPVNVTGLVPGRTLALSGKVTNPNDFEVNILSDKFTVTVGVDQTHGYCGAENFRIVPPTTLAASISAQGYVEFNGGSITMVNSATLDQKVCQGAVLTLAYLLQ